MSKFELQVEDMHAILLNISTELRNIRSAIESYPSCLTAETNNKIPVVTAVDESVANPLRKVQPTVKFLDPDLPQADPAGGAKLHALQVSSDQVRQTCTTLEVLGKALSRTQLTKRNKEFVILNVGGRRHEVCWETLDKFPNSRLGRLRKCISLGAFVAGDSSMRQNALDLCDDLSPSRGECFFDRSPRNFDAVLGLYRTGKLHLTQGVCVQDFCEELEFWGLSDLHLEACCQHTYYRARWLLPRSMKMDDEQEDIFGEGMLASGQRKLWNLFENPNSSFGAKIVAVLSCLFVVASTLSLIISTLPMFQQKEASGENEEHYIFVVAEAIFVGWFTFEYVVRFVAAPQKWRFAKAGMNVIDLFGVLPYFLSLGLSAIKMNSSPSSADSGAKSSSTSSYQDEMLRIAQIFRIMRILRIFKLARHITGLQTLGFTLKNSYKELGLLMLVVIMGMLIFSGLAYVSEKDEKGTAFVSMPQALYWAIITMTSVGYGDIYPITWFGKLVGSACAICGVLCISLPIPIIVNNFNKFYEKAKIEEEIDVKRKKASWEEAKKDLLDARRKSCVAAAGEWKKLIKVNSKSVAVGMPPSTTEETLKFYQNNPTLINDDGTTSESTFSYNRQNAVDKY